MIMKKKFFTVAIALTLVGSVSFTSCIGSFGLSNNLLSWNKSIGNKWVNEVVFFAFWILPVYEICVLADIIVLNTVEFWSGSNPVAAGEIKQVQGEKGLYTIETTENGYNITNELGEEMSLVYNQESKTWSSVAGDEEIQLFTFEDENNVTVHLLNGEKQSVELSQNGVLAFRQSLEESMYFASK